MNTKMCIDLSRKDVLNKRNMKYIKKITPDFIKSMYHRARGIQAAVLHGFPAKKLIVIGITGTKGKTSTGNYVWSVLRAGGYKAGLISSANFRIDLHEEPNSHHMTMPSPFFIQKRLRDMQKKGIEIVVVEMTSEGMKQFRHIGIPVDIAIFTNLTPEHLGSHKGNFELYKRAKAPLFQALNHPPRTLSGKKVPRTIIANADSEHSSYYLSFPADKKITFGIEHGDVVATDVVAESGRTLFTVGHERMTLSIPAKFNVYNALPAIIVGELFGISAEKIKVGLESLKIIPGRMELIDEGQNFKVFVDYAHEPASLNALITAAVQLKSDQSKIILLIGVIGGGRESRKPLAKIAAQKSDYLVITNEDPYDESPDKLIGELTEVASAEGKISGETLFPILDRREAIQKALSLATMGDIVLISGKGAETTMMTQNGPIPWNERSIVRELVQDYLLKNTQ